MNCEEARKLFDLFVDGALSAGDAERLDHHLAGCPACRAGREELSEMVSIIREIPHPATPEGFAGLVLKSLPAPGRGLLHRFLPAVVAASVILLAGLAWVALSPEGSSSDGLEVAKRSTLDVSPSRAEEGKQEGKLPVGGSEAPGPEEVFRCPGERTAIVAKALEGAGGDAAPGAPPQAPTTSPAKGSAGRTGGAGEIRSFLVAGEEPDTVAGVILAELDLHRAQFARKRRGADRREAVRNPRGLPERIVPDASGTPARLLLSLTPEEMEWVKKLIREREGAVLSPRAGASRTAWDQGAAGAAGDESGGDDLAECTDQNRLRVELIFRRDR